MPKNAAASASGSDSAPYRLPRGPQLSVTRPRGAVYECAGCGGDLPDGAQITEYVDDDAVVGLSVRMDADGPVVHACGTAATDT